MLSGETEEKTATTGRGRSQGRGRRRGKRPAIEDDEEEEERQEWGRGLGAEQGPRQGAGQGQGQGLRLSSGEELFGEEEVKEGDASASDNVEDVFTQAKTQLEEELARVAGHSRFNPHPDEREVRSLRTGYAKLLGEARSQKSELVRPDSSRLVEMMNDANELLGMVHTTVDATLDSRFIAQAADLGAEKISKLAAGTLDFGVSDFCTLVRSALIRSAGLANTMQSMANVEDEALMRDGGDLREQYDWNALGAFAMRRWRGVTGLDMLLGPITVEPRERRQRARSTRERQALEPAVEPLLLDGIEHAHLATSAAAETTNNVITVFQTLAAVAPVPFYRFICHPHSFAKTVENLFYISFLANDNRIKLTPDTADPQEMILHVLDDEDGEADDDAVRPKFQAIYSMTMSRWRDIVAKYRIAKPMIPL